MCQMISNHHSWVPIWNRYQPCCKDALLISSNLHGLVHSNTILIAPSTISCLFLFLEAGSCNAAQLGFKQCLFPSLPKDKLSSISTSRKFWTLRWNLMTMHIIVLKNAHKQLYVNLCVYTPTYIHIHMHVYTPRYMFIMHTHIYNLPRLGVTYLG